MRDAEFRVERGDCRLHGERNPWRCGVSPRDALDYEYESDKRPAREHA